MRGLDCQAGLWLQGKGRGMYALRNTGCTVGYYQL